MLRRIALAACCAALGPAAPGLAAQQTRQAAQPKPAAVQAHPVMTAVKPDSSDITFAGGVSFGSPVVKQANWGPTVTLNASAAHSVSSGYCHFYVTYQMHNNGPAATSAVFSNTISANSNTFSAGIGLSLSGGATLQKQVLVPLKSGANHILFQLDRYDAVKELDEKNNSRVLGITVEGSCSAETPHATPVTSPIVPSTPEAETKPVAQATSVTSPINGSGPVVAAPTQPLGSTGANQSPNLTGAGKNALAGLAADIELSGGMSLGTGQSDGNGHCLFPLTYTVRNSGGAGTGQGFTDRIWRNDGTQGFILTEHAVASLGAAQSRVIYTQIHLAPGSSELHLVIDLNHQVNESDESNNLSQIQVQVSSNCSGSPWLQGQEIRSGKAALEDHAFEVPGQESSAPANHGAIGFPTETISPSNGALGGPDTKTGFPTETISPGDSTAIIIHARQSLGQRLGRAGTGIHVLYANGVLMLSGTVKNAAEKQAAEQAVQGTPGVRLIQNQILMRTP